MAAGHPRVFNSGDELLELYREFCLYIIKENYNVVPFKTSFIRWLVDKKKLKVDTKTIYLSIEKYYPEVKAEFKALQSELIAQGSMLGKYTGQMSIFVLKSKCGWSDMPKESKLEAEEDPLSKSLNNLADSIRVKNV